MRWVHLSLSHIGGVFQSGQLRPGVTSFFIEKDMPLRCRNDVRLGIPLGNFVWGRSLPRAWSTSLRGFGTLILVSLASQFSVIWNCYFWIAQPLDSSYHVMESGTAAISWRHLKMILSSNSVIVVLRSGFFRFQTSKLPHSSATRSQSPR